MLFPTRLCLWGDAFLNTSSQRRITPLPELHMMHVRTYIHTLFPTHLSAGFSEKAFSLRKPRISQTEHSGLFSDRSKRY